MPNPIQTAYDFLYTFLKADFISLTAIINIRRTLTRVTLANTRGFLSNK